MARRPRCSGGLRTISCLVFLAALLAAPRPASAGQGVPLLHLVCEAPAGGTLYVSDVIGPIGLTLNKRAVFNVLSEEFQKFVQSKYSVNADGRCVRFTDEAGAKTYLKQMLATPPAGKKIVETHWNYETGSPAAAPPPAQTPAPKPATPAATGAAFHGFCFANYPGSIGYNKTRPTYFTPIFGFPKDGNYGALFGEYVAKKYSFLPWPAAQCLRQGISIDMVQPRQGEMSKAKQLGAPDIVETEWTFDTHQALMADLAKNAPAKPAPAPATKKAEPDDAPPATKPATAAATGKPAPMPAPPVQTAPQGPTMYAYCVAYGTPAARQTGPVKQHVYITQPFELRQGDRPNQAFQSFLQAGHPGEKISASCLEPGPLATAQTSRQKTIDLTKKQSAMFDVVEVDWKVAR